MKRMKQVLALLLSLVLMLGLFGLAEEPVEAAEEVIEEVVEEAPAEEAEAPVEEELPEEEAPVEEEPAEDEPAEEEPAEEASAEEAPAVLESMELASFDVEDLGAYKWDGEDRGSVTSVIIPEGYTSLDKDACLNMRSLTYVSIPSTVTLIDSGAFLGCESLSSISIPGNVVELGNSVFEQDDALTSVELHEGLEKIGNFTFSKCTSLSDIRIPSTVKEIGNSAFKETAVRSITLPKSIVKIGSAFSDCASLMSVTFEDGFSGTIDGTFGRCTSLKEISIPKGAIVGGRTFLNCTSLETVTFPEQMAQSMTMNRTFEGCTKLKAVYLPKNCKLAADSATDSDGNPYTTFYGCPDVTVYLFKGTQAETFCKEYNISYKYRTGTEGATVSLTLTETTLSQKEAVTLKATTEGISKKESYTFSSSDKSVATVSSKGKITAKGVGTAVITAKGKTSKQEASCTVTVISAPQTVRIEKPTKVDYTTDDAAFSLAASVEPADAAQSVKWTSSDETVARVSAEGLVTPVGQGKATITAKSEKKGTNGKQRSDSFVLQVTDPHMPASVKIAEKAAGPVYVDKDKTLTLSYELAPVTQGQEAASAVTWSIPKAKERKIATINSVTGEITPLKEGSVTVKITTQKKGGTGKKLKQLTDTVKITVVDPLKPREVKINGGEKEIPYYYEAGKTLTLQATIEPATATPGVTWSIPSKAHRKIATIDANTGVVTPTGTKYGVVTVKATTQAKKSNKKPATASIKIAIVDPNVVDPKLPYNVTITQEDGVELKDGVQLKVGGTLKLSARILPETATEQTALSWTIPAKQQKYATVDADGTVHGVKAGGSVTVTVQTANGKKDTVKIKIVK